MGTNWHAAAVSTPTFLIRVIRAHPITGLMVWFFTVGQAIAFAPLYLDTTVHSHWFIIASNFFGLLVPTLVITWISDGREGLARLWGRITHIRTSPRLYVLGLVVMPVLAIALAVMALGPPQAAAGTLAGAFWGGLVLSAVVGFVLANLWEEVAWTGFVQARLQQRHSALTAAVMVAPLFALQHLVLFIENGPVAVMLVLGMFTLVSIPFRAFNGWLYNRSGSLFLIGLVHAVGNAVGPGAGLSIGLLRRLYPTDADLVGVLHIAAFALIGFAVIAATRGRLGLRRDSTLRRDGGDHAPQPIEPQLPR